MVREIPKLRCPCCGKLSFFPNFVGFHRLDAFILKIKGLGRGKGFKNTYEVQKVENLDKFWIKRLQEVINWLKSQRPMEKKVVLMEEATSRKFPINYNAVLETSVSLPLMKVEKESLKSVLTKTQILTAPSSLGKSLQTSRNLSASLSEKRN